MLRNYSIRTILSAGITAALLDMSGAIIVYVFLLKLTSIQRILQTVAAGALGKSAYGESWATALAGLAFHTVIALCFAAVYYVIYPLWSKVFPNKWLAGAVYGCVVWAIMNIAVLPLVTGKPFHFQTDQFFFYSIGLIIFMVGIPISLITSKGRSTPGTSGRFI